MWLWPPCRWDYSVSHFSLNGWLKVSMVLLSLPVYLDPSHLGTQIVLPKVFSAAPCPICPHNFLKPKLHTCNMQFTFPSNNLLHYAWTVFHQTTRSLKAEMKSYFLSIQFTRGSSVKSKQILVIISLTIGMISLSINSLGRDFYSNWKEQPFIKLLLSDIMRVFNLGCGFLITTFVFVSPFCRGRNWDSKMVSSCPRIRIN